MGFFGWIKDAIDDAIRFVADKLGFTHDIESDNVSQADDVVSDIVSQADDVVSDIVSQADDVVPTIEETIDITDSLTDSVTSVTSEGGLTDGELELELAARSILDDLLSERAALLDMLPTLADGDFDLYNAMAKDIEERIEDFCNREMEGSGLENFLLDVVTEDWQVRLENSQWSDLDFNVTHFRPGEAWEFRQTFTTEFEAMEYVGGATTPSVLSIVITPDSSYEVWYNGSSN